MFVMAKTELMDKMDMTIYHLVTSNYEAPGSNCNVVEQELSSNRLE